MRKAKSSTSDNLTSTSKYRNIANLFGVSSSFVVYSYQGRLWSYNEKNGVSDFLSETERPAKSLFGTPATGGGPGPPEFFGPLAKKFAFTRQKIRRAVPKVTARVPIFRNARPKMNVVQMRLISRVKNNRKVGHAQIFPIKVCISCVKVLINATTIY